MNSNESAATDKKNSKIDYSIQDKLPNERKDFMKGKQGMFSYGIKFSGVF